MMTIVSKTIKNLRMAAIVAAIAFSTPLATAQDSGESEVARPVLSLFSLDLGHASVQDTYLTPITYKGKNLRLGYQHMQALGHDPEHWVRNLELGVEYDNVKNIVGNRTMHDLMVEGRWSLMRRWRNVLTPGLQLMGGGAAMLRGGAIYNPSNSNNIASVKAHIGVGVAGVASYQVNIKRLPITLSYQVSMPIVGAFYSPDYDESYFEIYVGNRSGLVHVAWPGARFEVNNLVSADLHLGGTILRVGYRHHYESSRINYITNMQSTHALSIALGGNILSVNPKKSCPSRVLYPLY